MYYICICVYIYTYSPKYCSVFVWGFYEQETMFCTQQTQQLTERDGDSYKKMGVLGSGCNMCRSQDLVPNRGVPCGKAHMGIT